MNGVTGVLLLGIVAMTTGVNYIKKEILAETGDKTVLKLEKMVFDKVDKRIFVAGVNRLYEYDVNLEMLRKNKIGPEMDNPLCPPRLQEATCEHEDIEMDVHSKALLLDYDDNVLINCISLFQGECIKYEMDNILIQKERVYRAVVANNATASTYAFIAPGAYEDEETGHQMNALYVGVQYVEKGWNRKKLPAFSSLRLDDFKIVKDSITLYKTMINADNNLKLTFPIFYKYGFSSEGFSYMITVQKESTDTSKESYVSKIFRVCQKDKEFVTYVELHLQCFHSGTIYNLAQTAHLGKAGAHLAEAMEMNVNEDVLYVTFSLGPPRSSEASQGSAICAYPMRDVRKTFTKNIQDCFGGTGNTGPPHFFKSSPCSAREDAKIDDNFCGGFSQMNSWVDGLTPISTSAAVIFQKHVLTSLTVHHVYDYTVAFAGTKSGKIVKISMDTQSLGLPYETVTLAPNEAIQPDMFVDLTEKYLYVMSENKLMKVLLYECDQYRSCGECLGAGNPYCGWCSLENKCSLRNECSEHDQLLRWLPYKGQTCPKISIVNPNRVQKQQKITELRLTVSNQPYFKGLYQCVFQYEKNLQYTITTTNTTLLPATPDGIMCETPEDHHLPAIPTGEDHINMTLSIRIGGFDFVSTNFTFYDCTRHESCHACTSTKFLCTWCIENHKCTSDAELNCKNNNRIYGDKGGALSPLGPEFCPRVVLKPESKSKIFVPSGTKKKITVYGENLHSFMEDIRCFFSIGQGVDVRARLVSDNIIECDDVNFYYADETEYVNVPFQINWRVKDSGVRRPLDNPDKIQVVVYKCNQMASTCGDCISMVEDYSCGWCKDTKSCTINISCTSIDWIRAGTCPNVEITRFEPHTGPREGGTKLTIYGKNLGIDARDIDGGITVAGVTCDPIIDEYLPPKKIVCKTRRMEGQQVGPVKVTINREYENTSKKQFTYVDPLLTLIYPLKGPKSGGTKVHIKGHNLDAGSDVMVTISGHPCTEVSRNATVLSCKTGPSSSNESGTIQARVDNQNINSQLTYWYINDPNVTSVSPIKGIVSGGIEIRVKGTNLEYVQKATMVFKEFVVLDEDDSRRRKRSVKEYYGSCFVPQYGQDTMMCLSPKINNNSVPDDSEKGVKFAYGLQLDNVYINRTGVHKEFFTIYPDPEFDDMVDRSYQSKTDNYLTINGRNLNLGFNTSDIIVKIGKSFCNVTSIDKHGNQLNCKPPKTQPPSNSGSKYPEIVVMVGRNYSKQIGYLQYEKTEVLSVPMIIGLSVGGGVLILVVICFVVLWCIKTRENTNMKKKWQIQMDNLEVKVAKECREAFAELQTEINECTIDQLGQVAIPFLDYRSYCMRVLFPSDEDSHPVIRDLDVDPHKREQIEHGLKLFSNLLANRTFLLVFIRTLEANRKFNMRDRVNVASLISVALQTRMEYATDILKTLLAELIEKSVEGKNHPKLLLRRTESVAEKMLTNWFTFLLYKFLRECAGEPLFMLYQAIKQQMGKGPVDAITSEARYSLSEDKLVRQHVDYKPMTIHVQDMDQFSQQSHPVKVLDCDTISQVKEKILDAIYKNAPFTNRPSKSSVDLVLFSSNPNEDSFDRKHQEKMILADIDNTTKVEGEFRRLNTLFHYQVLDGAYMALRLKQAPSLPDITSSANKSFDYHRLNNEYGSRSPMLNRGSPRSVQVDMELSNTNGGTKHYHLVKQHDQDNTVGDRGSKMVSEIYLTRLLATKGTLQQFVDDLFERIFSTSHRGTCLPLAIKYMFDFLDDQALLHNIQDQDVVHTWKSNSLPLRFWVNVIKNPNFVFDIYKSNIVDSCLSVVAQNFMDSCSMSEHKLGKDSPSSKLLYAKDIPTYKKWVDRYYHDVKMMPAISDQDITAMMNEESRSHQDEFNMNAALYELYKYVQSYSEDLTRALEEDEFAKKNRLCQKLDQVQAAMSGRDVYC